MQEICLKINRMTNRQTNKQTEAPCHIRLVHKLILQQNDLDFLFLFQTDMENPASVQAMIADICVEKCGQFSFKQEITTIMPHCGPISNQIFDFTIYL